MLGKSSSSLAARLIPCLVWALALGTVGTLAGCGQKGPLTLPAPPAAASAPR